VRILFAFRMPVGYLLECREINIKGASPDGANNRNDTGGDGTSSNREAPAFGVVREECRTAIYVQRLGQFLSSLVDSYKFRQRAPFAPDFLGAKAGRHNPSSAGDESVPLVLSCK
jgi:hypothetical protein